ncbi:hypothetical protein DERP_002202 [Dermatophagoides pteronyssinus]|uniref:Uncharacterized protein n=1 Tax=Dermatophagoides pteronyssinus TaxID=6956 RepID=A0ABQ8JH20_DERPT|nr:hypothetical protein DERP_002202 [Dermatophagoides pteronyssinus]
MATSSMFEINDEDRGTNNNDNNKNDEKNSQNQNRQQQQKNYQIQIEKLNEINQNLYNNNLHKGESSSSSCIVSVYVFFYCGYGGGVSFNMSINLYSNFHFSCLLPVDYVDDDDDDDDDNYDGQGNLFKRFILLLF